MAVITGRASKENNDFNYYKEKIGNAKKKIKEFPIINNIVDNFQGANKENSQNNLFLNLASVAVLDAFLYGKPNKSAEEELVKFEKLLKELLPKINTREIKNFKKRLKTLSGKNHYEKIIELKFYNELLNNQEIKELNYEEGTKGNHDFNLILNDDTEFNIEVTSLGIGKVEEKVKKGFNLACKKILEDFDDKKLYLQITIDLGKVPLTERDTPRDISQFIIKYYNKLKPLIFIDNKGLCIIRDFKSSKESLWELKDIFEYYNEFGKRLLKLTKTEEGKKFLKNIKNGDIINSSFENFIISPSKTQVATLHSRVSSHTEAEFLRKNSLLRRLKDVVKFKIEKKQLSGKKNSFIAINFEDFAFMNYWDIKDYFGNQGFEELKIAIQGIFTNKNEKEILGVLLFNKELEKSRFIKNPNIELTRDILEKINILTIKTDFN